jgi:hypothetical protein
MSDGVLSPGLVGLLRAGRAGGAVSELVEEFDHKIEVTVDQVDAHRAAGAPAAQVVMEAMDQVVDQQHFFGELFGLGKNIAVMLEQLDHLRTAIQLLVFGRLQQGMVGAGPAAGLAAEQVFRPRVFCNAAAAGWAGYAAGAGLFGEDKTLASCIQCPTNFIEQRAVGHALRVAFVQPAEFVSFEARGPGGRDWLCFHGIMIVIL